LSHRCRLSSSLSPPLPKREEPFPSAALLRDQGSDESFLVFLLALKGMALPFFLLCCCAEKEGLSSVVPLRTAARCCPFTAQEVLLVFFLRLRVREEERRVSLSSSARQSRESLRDPAKHRKPPSPPPNSPPHPPPHKGKSAMNPEGSIFPFPSGIPLFLLCERARRTALFPREKTRLFRGLRTPTSSLFFSFLSLQLTWTSEAFFLSLLRKVIGPYPFPPLPSTGPCAASFFMSCQIFPSSSPAGLFIEQDLLFPLPEQGYVLPSSFILAASPPSPPEAPCGATFPPFIRLSLKKGKVLSFFFSFPDKIVKGSRLF